MYNCRSYCYLLSIITINKNNSEGLLKTICSFGSLSGHKDIEFIFIDGESIDASVKIAKSFYTTNAIFSEPDAGIYNAMNKGLYRCSGKYVLWINSGDEIMPNIIEHIISILTDSSEAIISFGVKVVDSLQERKDHEWYSDRKDLPRSTFPHQGCFFLRYDLLSVGGYDEKYRYAGDRDLILRLYYANKNIKTIREVVSVFYTGGISFSRDAMLEGQMIDKKYHLASSIKLLWRRLRYNNEVILGPFKRAVFGGK